MDLSRFRTWASKPAFEQPLRRTARALASACVGLLFVACRSDYPIAPTACDDYCLALQRGDCKDDQPADCVRSCEQERSRAAGCDASLATLSDCYAHSGAREFSCADDHTLVGAVCLDERRAWNECKRPGSGLCFDECVRQHVTCQSSLDDCEFGCQSPAPGCEEAANAYYACIRHFPAECHVWGEVDARSADEIPCVSEVAALFACGK